MKEPTISIEIIPFMKRVAEDAGRIIKSYQKEGFRVRGKVSKIDIVTDADQASERFIMREIKR
jgi:fructose-1,6-bisphosphatase/inositol monophosphatase family enzyme